MVVSARYVRQMMMIADVADLADSADDWCGRPGWFRKMKSRRYRGDDGVLKDAEDDVH